MHPTDKKIWPIMIVGGILYFIFIMLPNAKLAHERDDADTQAWKARKEEQRREDQKTQRLRDAVDAVNR